MNRILKVLLAVFVLLIGYQASAERIKIQIKPTDILTSASVMRSISFTQLKVKGFENEKTVGAPELPVKSWLIQGTPENIQVQLTNKSFVVMNNTRPYPTQKQLCRCADDKAIEFTMNNEIYQKGLQQVQINYLGDFRGQPISRVDVRLGTYDADLNQVKVMVDVEVDINQPIFSLNPGDDRDYLIIAPDNLAEGVNEFADYKRRQGYNVFIESISSPNNVTAAIQSLIKKYYTDFGIDFAILIGGEKELPMFRLSTSGGSTPSDLPYFTMGGANDYIPDIFASRIVASTPANVAAQLAKAIEFEQKTYINNAGLKSSISIASNEGFNPSDKEYVLAIDKAFNDKLNIAATHFYENDPKSNPKELNTKLAEGAVWLTYLGHGSGTSWPSMYSEYFVKDIAATNNKDAVKPIIIDVACQNGRLISGNLGALFMSTQSTQSNSYGAAAYYGGTVDISWHPPAVMAQGIAFEHIDKNFKHLGEALLAGQLYLATKWNNHSQVVDNLEWYHLQGDPGMNIQF